MGSDQAIVHLVELGKRIRDRISTASADNEFNRIRASAGDLVNALANDPTNSAIIQAIINTNREFEILTKRNISEQNLNRSVVNQSVLSVRIKGTHYSSFIAGRYGESQRIGSKFKCWLYNVASHGALEAADIIGQISKNIDKDTELSNIAGIFKSSAMADAARFLEWARVHDETSALRIFNSARLDLMSNHPDRIRFGIDRLSKIDPPNEQSEAADICWHEDNWQQFSTNSTMRQIIEQEAANKLEIISNILRINHDKAKLIRDGRDIWKKENKNNKAAMASFSVTFLAIGSYIATHPSALNDIYDLTKDIFDYMQEMLSSHVDPQGSILHARGDGGLAGPTRLARAVFGDGGLA